jgi:hypothetical protein
LHDLKEGKAIREQQMGKAATRILMKEHGGYQDKHSSSAKLRSYECI